jgi:hypothetical protein
MRFFRSVRWLMLALLLPLIPTSQARAGVFISVNIAPPVLPVYVQPPCPEPGLMWAPGYWAYDYDNGGYYWVPGAWVPAPYEGALWTPPYWGWSSGVYLFHPGYWGMHVGYYGGVNYGFGYMGIGFVGGEWRGREFAYNTAVINVNRTVIHNTYVNTTIVNKYTVVNNNHIAYSGGPHGIQHRPMPEEQMAMHERHLPPTQYQQQHIQSARGDRQNFYNRNHGKPAQLALARPLPAAHYQPPAMNAGARGQAGAHSGAIGTNASQLNHQGAGQTARPMTNGRPGNTGINGGANAHPGGANGNANAGARGQYQPGQNPRPNVQQHPNTENRPNPGVQPNNRPMPESRPAPQMRPAPQSRPAPQMRPAPQPRQESRPAPQSRPAPNSQSKPREPRH